MSLLLLLDALRASAAGTALSATAAAIAATPTIDHEQHEHLLCSAADEAVAADRRLRAGARDWADGSLESQHAVALQLAPLLDAHAAFCAARTPADYASALLTAHSRGDLVVPLAFLQPLAASSWEHDHGSTKSVTSSNMLRDTSEHQAQRDVERDSIRVNGRLFVGAKEGYVGVVSAIIAAMRAAETSAFGEGMAAHDTSNGLGAVAYASAVSRAVLRRVNRTVSGGDAFDAALQLYAPAGGDVGAGATRLAALQVEHAAHQPRVPRAGLSAHEIGGSSNDAAQSGPALLTSTGRLRGNASTDDDSDSADDDDDDPSVGMMMNWGSGWPWGEVTGRVAPRTQSTATSPSMTPASTSQVNSTARAPATPLVVLVPDSHAAPPLELFIDFGPYQLAADTPPAISPLAAEPHSHVPGVTPALLREGLSAARWRVGMRVLLRATTVYRIIDAGVLDGSSVHGADARARDGRSSSRNQEDSSDSSHIGEYGRVIATFEQRVAALPLFVGGCDSSVAGELRGASGEAAITPAQLQVLHKIVRTSGQRAPAHASMLTKEGDQRPPQHHIDSLPAAVWNFVDRAVCSSLDADDREGGHVAVASNSLESVPAKLLTTCGAHNSGRITFSFSPAAKGVRGAS